jgi:hypothetical protein
MTAPTRSTSDSDLVKVAYAHDQAEAEFLQGLLHDADVGSVVRRAPGLMCRSSLPAVRVTCSSSRPTSPSRETSCARVNRMRLRHRRGPAPTGRRGCSPGC